MNEKGYLYTLSDTYLIYSDDIVAECYDLLDFMFDMDGDYKELGPKKKMNNGIKEFCDIADVIFEVGGDNLANIIDTSNKFEVKNVTPGSM